MRIAGYVAMALLMLAAVAVIEMAFRWNGKYATYGERNGLGYISPYALDATTWYIRHAAGTHRRVTADFDEPLVVNADGFADRPFPAAAKSPGELRIATFGDSFVEGMGSLTPEGSYPRVLETALNERLGGRSVRVMNGGVSGSDPVFNLQALTRVLAPLGPDIIVQSVNSTDWEDDIVIRGGLERFGADGSVRPQAPWFEPLYEHSHVVRALLDTFFKVGASLLTREERERRRDGAVGTICAVLAEERTVADRLGAKLVVVLQPLKRQVEREPGPDARWQAIAACAAREAHATVDLWAGLAARAPQGDVPRLYWPTDFHFTPEGYRLYGVIVADAVGPLLPAAR